VLRLGSLAIQDQVFAELLAWRNFSLASGEEGIFGLGSRVSYEDISALQGLKDELRFPIFGMYLDGRLQRRRIQTDDIVCLIKRAPILRLSLAV
jgi:hypothetical protein